MRHALGGGLVIARQRVPADIDAGRDDQPVIRQARAVGERDGAGLRIDRGRALRGQFDPGGAQLVVAELLVAQIAQPGDHEIAERAGGVFGIRLDQRHGETRVEALQGAGAGRAGKAAADHDDPRRGALRQRWSAEPRSGGQHAEFQDVAPGPAADASALHGSRRRLRGVPRRDGRDLVVGEALGDARHDRPRPLSRRGTPASPSAIRGAGRPARRGTGVSTAALAA